LSTKYVKVCDMECSSNAFRVIKESVVEGVVRISSWIVTQLATYIISPKLGSAISLAIVSVFALRKFGVAIKMRSRENFLEYVKNKIIELEMEIDSIKKKISILNQAYGEVGDESKKISIEDQLRTDASRLKELTSIKLYFETLIRAIQVIEPLRHIHGDRIDKIYDRIIDLSNKASDGKISEKEVNEIINRFSSLIDGVPEFPYILLEVAEEKLK